MCGRFTLRVPTGDLASLFQFPEAPNAAPRYNIAPSQPILCVRQPAGAAAREGVLLRWGLVPFWEKGDRPMGVINARSETAATRPSFRAPFRLRRCLIPADAFYEWKQLPGRRKQPLAFTVDDGAPFAFAGLWDRWQAGTGEALETAAILTTQANDLLRPVHERMPVILPREHYQAWLDPHFQSVDQLEALLRPFPAERMNAVAVGDYVNDARHEGEQCLRPLSVQQPSLF
jgi:putative SOS response-associated peptidase YedK